jgi:hypothetical protein
MVAGSIYGGEIKNNILAHNTSSKVTNTYGYQLEGDLKNFEMSGNIVYNIGGPSLRVRASYGENEGLVIKDNIFSDENNTIGVVRVLSTDEVTISDNSYYCAGDQQFYYFDKYIGFDEWVTATNDNSEFAVYSFTDPTRSIETYQASIGGEDNIDAFIKACRDQGRYNWDENYTASKVGAWFKEGFKH